MIMMKPAAGTERPKQPERRNTEAEMKTRQTIEANEAARAELRKKEALTARERAEAADAAQLSDLRQDMQAKFGREFSLEPQQELIGKHVVVGKKFFSGVFEITIEMQDEFKTTIRYRTRNPLVAEQLYADAVAELRETDRRYSRAYRGEKDEERKVAEGVKTILFADIKQKLQDRYAAQLERPNLPGSFY
jgi:hypothetical protein